MNAMDGKAPGEASAMELLHRQTRALRIESSAHNRKTSYGKDPEA